MFIMCVMVVMLEQAKDMAKTTCVNIYIMCFPNDYLEGGIHGPVVVHWTAGQHVELSILHQGHDS